MGLFHRNENEANFAGGSKNVMESIQRATDTNTLIYLDPRVDFNSNSVITVAPNEQSIFIKNGELYGVLPSGRHEIKAENYPVLSRIRNMLTGGVSTFTCQVYHVSLSEQNVLWGTPSAIEIQDYHLGGGDEGVQTYIRGAGTFRVRFNIHEDDGASVQAFMRLMGDKSAFTVNDLGMHFQDQISQEINVVVGETIEELSRYQSINGISRQLKVISEKLTPTFIELFEKYGFELVNFSFKNLSIDETEIRSKYMDRRIAAANITNVGAYDKAVQQELLENISLNSSAGGVASAGAGLGMGMAAGNAFAQMATNAFSPTQPQQPAVSQQVGFGGQARFGGGAFQQTPQQPTQPDPVETLTKMKQMLDAGLITQEVYDAKVQEVMSRM